MYYDYFGLDQPPFKITPDTRLFYPGGERGAVLEALLYAITHGEGIVKVVGEVGTGKTMLCRMLEKELPDRVEVVYLANPSLSPENTLHAIAFELGLEVNGRASRFEVMNRLQQFLLERHSQNRQVVVFVEEAQGMPLATLEEVRLLSNLETQQHKLLQIVLFGQPELDAMMATPRIRQLKERITYSFRLKPFAPEDIRDYLNSRIRACGYRSGPLFDTSAVAEISRYSRGLLRRINILADKAMLAAYAENTSRVSARHINKAARDSEFVTDSRRWSRPLAWGIAAAVVLGIAGLLIALQIRPGMPTSPAGPAPSAPADEAVSQAPAADEPAPGGAPSSAAKRPDQAAADATEPQPVPTREAVPVPEAAEESPAGPGAATGPEPPSPDGALAAPGASAGLDRLSGLEAAVEMPEDGEFLLTEEEIDVLRQQVRDLPPETVVVSGSVVIEEECEHCWSFIYRPLPQTGNL